MQTSLDKILVGRDRITTILNTYFAPQDALERANNIAQVLLYSSDDPAQVALEMLRRLDISDRIKVAVQVGEAWTSNSEL
jgi:hypothetical protein